MCAILDVNRAHQLLPSSPSEPNDPLAKWVKDGHVKLIVGGKLLDELGKNSNIERWITNLHRMGRIVSLTSKDRRDVKCRTEELRKRSTCRSNDEHIIALAQIKHVRLLVTADRDLRKDFGNPDLIDGPRGKVYPSGASLSTRKKFLNRAEGCPSGC